MYVCVCNVITDDEILDHLDTLNTKTSAKEAYMACSGGTPHACGQCKPMVKDLVKEHNNKINVQDLADGVNVTAPQKTNEPV